MLLFLACALVPTSLLAFFTFKSVSRQLTDQSNLRLTGLAGGVGRTLYGRLIFVESDLRKIAPRLVTCGRCGDELLYTAELVALVPDLGEPQLVAGEGSELGRIATLQLPVLGPDQSTVITAQRTVYLVHRPAGPAARAGRLVVRLTPSALWGRGDEAALPPGLELSIWDPEEGVVFGAAFGTDAIPKEAADRLTKLPSGSFEWNSAKGAALASWWSLPESRRFRLPHWRVLLSEGRGDVIAPALEMIQSLPLLLAVVLATVLLIGLAQIRRSLVPLAELHHATRRIAARDFDGRVEIVSNDELGELAGAFNSMASQLGRQFQALKTAAEIDRAVLSSVDSASIVQAVLDRIPEICPCDGLSVTLLDPAGGTPGTTWVALGNGAPQTRVRAEPRADDIRRAKGQPDRIRCGPSGAPLPTYLAHFVKEDAPVDVEIFPLRYAGELLGMLALRRQGNDAMPEDWAQVRRIADQVAVALSNARMMDQVRFLAFYDSLTKLPNRVLYKERLAQALVRAERNNRLVAVCFLDLDHFSRINDTLGHDLGDLLLKEVSARLLAASRPGDSLARVGTTEDLPEVARLGGDEFTVILPDLTDPQDAVRVARRLLETLRRPIRLGTQEIFVTSSIGIAIYPFDGTETEDLLKSADVAMYHAKQEGRNTYSLYSASMNAEAMARMELERQLRKAVEAGEFTLWYQPIVDLRSGHTVGAEALVRWAHPERGLVSPAEFISLCEECGLIVPLGEWILRTVCQQARAWEAAGLGTLRMSVNLSARQLRHDGIVETVRGILKETGFRPRSLVLELTESMLMEPTGVVGRTIRELADLGVSLAIDDFGTGYSSLSYLKNFPVTTLKIDRSFISDVTGDPDAAAITTAIIALAQAMELDVVAEGVEREDQAAFLREKGCAKIQGFLVGYPAPPNEFAGSLRPLLPRLAEQAAVA
ncbi:MAG: EAL domain-containing protein [Gemmatimonadales bacterium]|nr:EAL domain-containing protein [Gemmatimonadales bacterium]